MPRSEKGSKLSRTVNSSDGLQKGFHAVIMLSRSTCLVNRENRPPNDPSAGQNIGYDDLARHKYWHFVDLPFSDDHTTLPTVPTPNAETQIAAFRAVLATESNDPKLEKLKSYDLSWLLHLVGDVHNPFIPPPASEPQIRTATTAVMA